MPSYANYAGTILMRVHRCSTSSGYAQGTGDFGMNGTSEYQWPVRSNRFQDGGSIAYLVAPD